MWGPQIERGVWAVGSELEDALEDSVQAGEPTDNVPVPRPAGGASSRDSERMTCMWPLGPRDFLPLGLGTG